MASTHTATGCNNTPGLTKTAIGTGTLDVSKMANAGVDSSIPSDSAVSLPGGTVVVVPSSPDGDAIPGDAASPPGSNSTNATAALPGDAITPAAEESTCHGPSTTSGTLPQVRSGNLSQVLTWKTYLWFRLSVLGIALPPIFVTLIFDLSQSDHSVIIYVVMPFIDVAILFVTFFLHFALTHSLHYLINKFADQRFTFMSSVIVNAIFCIITIVSSELSKSDVALYIHFIAVTYSCTFMALWTYIFHEDIGNARAIFTTQALAYTLYYYQQHMGVYMVLYAITSVIGISTLIIGGDGPVESINVAFLRIISFTPRVQQNCEDIPLRSMARPANWNEPVLAGNV